MNASNGDKLETIQKKPMPLTHVSDLDLFAMDPSTTLFTFMLQTEPSVRFVHIFGSWDNFSTYHTMERDSRRGLGHWRGCHSFRDFVGESSKGTAKKNSGLKMGGTYYYYYELDGSKEVHDPTMPSTNACPLLPGQPLNTLSIPVEQTLRHRSASLNSLRSADFRTMNPKERFLDPRPSSRAEETMQRPPSRVGSSPLPRGVSRVASPLPKEISRTSSPTPSWKRFLSFRKNKHDGERGFGHGRGRSMADRPVTPMSIVTDDTQSVTSEGSRTRDISPESLRRFFSDDTPSPMPTPEQRPTLVIPEDIVEENENDDDDNFATSAVSDHNNNYFTTSLSPPPSRPGHSRSASTSAIMTLSKASAIPKPEPLVAPSRPHNQTSLPKLSVSGPGRHYSTSPVTSSTASSMSPRSPVDINRDSIFSPIVSAGEEETFTFHPVQPASKPHFLMSPLFGNFTFQGEAEKQAEPREPMVDRWMANVINSRDNYSRS